MECWLVIGIVVLLEMLGLAWPGPPPPPPRGGQHRATGVDGAMRSWPGSSRED